jgi:hypothetical protein
MQLYAGLDLHLRNTYIGILDKEFKRIFKKRVANNLELILQTLNPFGSQLKGLVVESTYNWYWLIDGLMDNGYQCVHLANPKKDRPVRDLARKRMFLVQHRTAHILSLQSLIARCCAKRISSNEMRHLTLQDLQHLLEEQHLVVSAQANLDSIRFLTQQIKKIEDPAD